MAVTSASDRAAGVVWRAQTPPAPLSVDFSTNGCRAPDRGPFNLHPLARHSPISRPQHHHHQRARDPPPPPPLVLPPLYSTILSVSFPFTSSSFAAFVVRCTLVTPVYPPQQPCRLLALVGHFWRLLPRRRHHTSATSPDLLTRFCTSTAILPYCHCICCYCRCTSYHWLCLFTSNASCHGKQTLQFLHCLSAEQLRSQQETLCIDIAPRHSLRTALVVQRCCIAAPQPMELSRR